MTAKHRTKVLSLLQPTSQHGASRKDKNEKLFEEKHNPVYPGLFSITSEGMPSGK